MDEVKSEEEVAVVFSNSSPTDEWKCCLLVDAIDVYGNIGKVDLVERLVPNEKVQLILQQKYGFPHKTWFRFGKSFDGIEGRDNLIKMITETANVSGFSLVVAKNEKVNTKQRRWVVRFVCDRSRAFRPKATTTEGEVSSDNNDTKISSSATASTKPEEHPKIPLRRNTTKAIRKSECCSFSLTVFLEKEGRGWYLSVYPSTVGKEKIGFHWGHEKMPKTSIKASVRRLDHQVLKLVNCCQEVGLSATESALLIQSQTSVRLDSKQVEYLKSKAQAAAAAAGRAANNNKNGPSSSDKG